MPFGLTFNLIIHDITTIVNITTIQTYSRNFVYYTQKFDDSHYIGMVLNMNIFYVIMENERGQLLMLKYKIDVLKALKERGYTSYRLATDRILSNGSIQKLRRDEVLSTDGLSTLCELLECQPGDLLENIPCKTNNKSLE